MKCRKKMIGQKWKRNLEKRDRVIKHLNTNGGKWGEVQCDQMTKEPVQYLEPFATIKFTQQTCQNWGKY